MIRKDCIQRGDKILVRSLICKYAVPVTVTGIAKSGEGVYVDDGCGLDILVGFNECLFDTKANRDRIVNHNPY